MIMVTGATGNLGRLIIENLVTLVDANQVVALARTPEKAAAFAEKGIEVRQGDYEDYTSLVSAFQGADVLMFISNSDFGRREEQHRNVVNAAKEADVGRIVYTSFVVIDADNPLAASHQLTEQQIKASGLAHTFLRPNFYMDLYVGEVEIAIQNGAYRSPNGKAGAAFVSRADIARMAAAVLTHEGQTRKVYELTGPSTVTPAVFAEVASAISGKRIIYQPISWDELAQDFRERGMPEQGVQMSVGIQQMIASNALAKVSNDIGQVTGISAVSFLEFVKTKLADEGV